MNLPFLRYFNFKKDKGSDSGGGVAVAPVPRPVTPIAKPASERFGKTVMPNASRIVGVAPRESFPMPSANRSSAPAPAGPRKISLGGDGAIAVAPNAAAGSPVGERTIALQLADLVEQMPAGVLQPTPVDPEKRVIFKASELERGMASGRPAVSLRSIFQQAPDFFVSDVAADDAREVVLPFGKVLEQFTAFQVRPDQVADEAVPQLETPFLKMTLEDGQRFGKASAPIPAPTPVVPAAIEPEIPPVAAALPEPEPVPAPAPAPAPAAAAPAAPRTIRPLRLPLPNEAQASPAEAAAPAPRKISPNGTGVPATERVPASSGPPVPTPLPSPFAPPPPMRIPFKVSPPSNDLRTPAPAAESTPLPKPAAVAFSPDGPRVRLPLRNVLRGIAPFQLSGPVDQVPETAMVEIPYSIIEPQLSLGRIAVSPAQFQAALPEEFRALFKLEESEMPVVLPLQEVLQNLPHESLQLRGDQEEIVLTETFETPFSTKAAEDAARMKVSSGPIAKASVEAAVSAAEPSVEAAVSAADPNVAAAVPTTEPEISAPENLVLRPTPPPLQAPVAPAERSALQVAFDTDETLDAKTMVAHASKLPGVLACAIVFSDGLSLAGNIPAEYQTEALCALAPSIMKRINDQMVGATLGPLDGITLYCAKTPVSFFAHENICLAVLHSDGEIASDVRARLSCAARELARMYAQPA